MSARTEASLKCGGKEGKMGSKWWNGRRREAMEVEWKEERMKEEDKPLVSPRRRKTACVSGV